MREMLVCRKNAESMQRFQDTFKSTLDVSDKKENKKERNNSSLRKMTVIILSLKLRRQPLLLTRTMRVIS